VLSIHFSALSSKLINLILDNDIQFNVIYNNDCEAVDIDGKGDSIQCLTMILGLNGQ